ncbi:hypothetical protein HDU91_005235 [Kappamyces sp. JEL0680]|nr:hypothetical protein HDU91_005235 [Kappamyces sp. JEL0680]
MRLDDIAPTVQQALNKLDNGEFKDRPLFLEQFTEGKLLYFTAQQELKPLSFHHVIGKLIILTGLRQLALGSSALFTQRLLWFSRLAGLVSGPDDAVKQELVAAGLAISGQKLGVALQLVRAIVWYPPNLVAGPKDDRLLDDQLGDTPDYLLLAPKQAQILDRTDYDILTKLWECGLDANRLEFSFFLTKGSFLSRKSTIDIATYRHWSHEQKQGFFSGIAHHYQCIAPIKLERTFQRGYLGRSVAEWNPAGGYKSLHGEQVFAFLAIHTSIYLVDFSKHGALFREMASPEHQAPEYAPPPLGDFDFIIEEEGVDSNLDSELEELDPVDQWLGLSTPQGSLKADYDLFKQIQPKGQRLVFAGYTTGLHNTQNFVCTNSEYVLQSATATLNFVVHHFFNATHPVFQAPDNSTVAGLNKTVYPSPEGQLSWVVLDRVTNGAKKGLFASINTVIRSFTDGGVAPASCNETSPQTISVPYSALYTFYQ